jgi:transposase
MQIREREVGDVARIEEMIALEKHADKRERYRVALLAQRGHEKLEIAQLLGMAKSTVEHWAYAYRDRGIDALAGKPRGGGVPKIRGEHAQLLKQRIDEGPRDSDGVCTLRGKDLQRIAREELGVAVGLSCVYRTLERMGYSCLAPRPRHEKQDLVAQKKFKDQAAPLL